MMLEDFDAISPASNTNPTDVLQANHVTVDHYDQIQTTPTEISGHGNFEEPQNDGGRNQKPIDYQRNYDSLFSFERYVSLVLTS